MELKYKIGDMVMLISGGPIMTVVELNKTMARNRGDVDNYNGTVKCSWFEGNEAKSVTFHQDALKHQKKE